MSRVRTPTDASKSDGCGRACRSLAAAVEWIDQGGQFAPEFQERLRREAREFSVGEAETLTLDLRLTPDL